MFVQLDEKTVVNTDKITAIRTVEDTDKYEEPHVLIDFGYMFLELDPTQTITEILGKIEAATGGETLP